MRYVRYEWADQARWGLLLSDELIQPLTAAPYLGGLPQGAPVPLPGARLLAPCEPGKIVAVGKNYRDHIAEMGGQPPQTPILFLKPTSALIGPGQAIVLPDPSLSSRVDFEGELAVVISRRARKVSAQEAASCVLGYTCFNDVTARDIQQQDGQWTRAKGFDTFAPLGPLVTDEVDPGGLALRTRVNGQLKQDSSTSQLIWSVPDLIAFISQAMTLMPGDVVATGTPAGVGPLRAGDVVDISVEGIGVLKNPVRSEAQSDRFSP